MPVTDPPKDWSLERTGARIAEGMLRAKFGADLWGDINVGHIDTGVQRHQIFGDWVMIDRGVNYMEPGQPPIDPLKSASFGGHGTRTLSILTGSAAEIISVTQIDQYDAGTKQVTAAKKISNGEGPLTKKLRAKFREIVTSDHVPED